MGKVIFTKGKGYLTLGNSNLYPRYRVPLPLGRGVFTLGLVPLAWVKVTICARKCPKTPCFTAFVPQNMLIWL